MKFVRSSILACAAVAALTSGVRAETPVNVRHGTLHPPLLLCHGGIRKEI